ncbi:MAG TPA: SpoIIE family protein phosphatase [Kribbella sp.]
MLCFYTDGLIERRKTTIGTNLARLCESVVPGPPDTIYASVMAALVGRETVRDDIAPLNLRRTP